MENRRIQEDEVGTLQAIYGEDFKLLPQEPSVSYSISVATPDNTHSLEVQITYPEGYPTSCHPVYELRGSEWLGSEDIPNISREFTQIHKENEGEMVVYQWIECLRDYIANIHVPVKEEATAGTTAKAEEESHLPTHEQTSLPPAHLDRCLREREREGDWSSEGGLLPELGPAQAGPGSSEPWEGERTECPHIAHGEPLTDRRSTFQAHAAAVSSKTEVAAVVAELKKNKKIASATHNILAYRLFDSAKGGVMVQDCDDDGESAAGGRLLHLLQMMDATNTVVVVSRWYGGILLHGDRFKHINNVARTLLQETGIGLQRKETATVKGTNRKGRKRTKH